MIVAVADTHVVTWYLSVDSRLSSTAKRFLDTSAKAGDKIAVSAISLVEMVYLVEKGKISAQHFTQLANELDKENSPFVEIAVNLKIARALSRIDVNQIPDMPDRIVAATAVYLQTPVISRDYRIQLSNMRTIG
jgi:PIN domain nuclease of toxin-antitoxin system